MPSTLSWILSGGYSAKDPAKKRHDPLQPAKPERTTAVARMIAGIAFMENINLSSQRLSETWKQNSGSATMLPETLLGVLNLSSIPPCET